MLHARVLRMLVIALCASANPIVAADDAGTIEGREFSHGGRERSYFFYAPESQGTDAPLPLLLLLHGSGGTGEHMLRAWRALAARERVVLAAPNAQDADAWHLRADGPAMFHDLVTVLAREHPIDRRRVYLFGHSGGAVYALILAMLESEYFAAAAVHAGAWRTPGEHQALELAKRKIPIALFVGDIDEFFSVRAVRETERTLRSASHPVTVTIMRGHGHGYRRVADQVNAAAWRFLREHSLHTEPRFRPLQSRPAD